MWKPTEVAPEHRWRARVVWASLLVSITAYAIWQAWKMFRGYKNPSTSLEVTNETYEFPYVLVCFFQNEGCGWEDGSFDVCLSTSLDWSTVIDHNDEYREDLVVESMWSNCLGFDLTKLNVVDAGVPPDLAIVSVDMEWIESDIASEELNYYDRVSIYLSDKEPTEDSLSFLSVPYARSVPNDDPILPLPLAELTIGKTTKENLDGEITTSYPPLILSSSTLHMNNTWETQTATDYAYGQLNIRLHQGIFSRTSVKELSPLDVGSFLGNIGGFWELLILLWGLFFIATRDDNTPKLKARKFVQPVKEIIRRRSLSVDSGASASQGEEHPHWEPAFHGANPLSAPPPLPPRGGVARAAGAAAALDFPMIPSINGGSRIRQPTGAPSASFRRPVVQDLPSAIRRDLLATHRQANISLSNFNVTVGQAS